MPKEIIEENWNARLKEKTIETNAGTSNDWHEICCNTYKVF